MSLQCRRLLALLAADPPLSYAEIAERLATPVGSLGPTRARCLDKLRSQEPLAAFIDRDVRTSGGRR
jgi:DNA-directed RNA polymerase specialized sigma24 family protein